MRLPARDIIVACLPDAHFLSLEDWGRDYAHNYGRHWDALQAVWQIIYRFIFSLTAVPRSKINRLSIFNILSSFLKKS